MSAQSPNPKPPALEAIAFDWGGIFTEGTFDSSAVANLAELLGTDVETVSATYVPLMEEFEVGAFDLDGFTERFRDRSGFEIDPHTFQTTFLGSVRERTAMFSILGAIPPAYTVGMLSNNVPTLCDRVRDDGRMARTEHFVFSNEIGVRKPDARAFAALTEALGIPAEATVFIDDNAANIAACEELGFTGILLDDFEGFLARWRALFPEIETGLVPG